MRAVKDLRWVKSHKVAELVDAMGNLGFQSIELCKAAETTIKMKKAGAKIILTYTSNMVTSGLRGFFAQLIELGIPDLIITTVGGIEEDIMKAAGESFVIGSFEADDLALNEQGLNRIGNLYIKNESYCKFEDMIRPILEQLYAMKNRWAVSEMLNEIGKMLNDNKSILYQASGRNVPIFCPAITDGAFGFHLYMFQQKHKDFVVDVVKDFEYILNEVSQDDKKGLIALGGGVSKHHAILASLLSGGLDYAVYMTTSKEISGSMGSATTREAKSWGKVKDDSDVVTVIGDVTITFPLMMIKVLETLDREGLLNA
ncbi:deoxyhypusine synthase family protein [Candidatus Woesearchaeota archaeon]|nr:deoxyhypusine synthase family protein [Candidatus Woesearchaeota archaeon]